MSNNNFIPVSTLDEYRERAKLTRVFTPQFEKFYPAIKLVGEVGESCEVIGKFFRDSNGVPSPEFTEKLTKELGDVCWYVFALLDVYRIPTLQMSEIKLISQYNEVHITGTELDAHDITLVLASMAHNASAVLTSVSRGIGFGGLHEHLNQILVSIVELGNNYGITLDRILNTNIQKLEDRKARNVLHGSGDNR